MINFDQFTMSQFGVNHVYADADGMLTLNPQTDTGADNEKVGFLTAVSYSSDKGLDVQLNIRVDGPVSIPVHLVSDKNIKLPKKAFVHNKKKVVEKPFKFLDLGD